MSDINPQKNDPREGSRQRRSGSMFPTCEVAGLIFGVSRVSKGRSKRLENSAPTKLTKKKEGTLVVTK